MYCGVCCYLCFAAFFPIGVVALLFRRLRNLCRIYRPLIIYPYAFYKLISYHILNFQILKPFRSLLLCQKFFVAYGICLFLKAYVVNCSYTVVYISVGCGTSFFYKLTCHTSLFSIFFAYKLRHYGIIIKFLCTSGYASHII